MIHDPELEHKIDTEVKMIDGIGKLLNVATNPMQIIECHKALIVSQQRMLAYMAEIQRKQQKLLSKDDNNLVPTKAVITISDIRFPLTWTDLKAKADQKKFAVFCLARIGTVVLDTSMKYIDRQAADILFTDKLIFDNVPHNFQLTFEVYALNTSLAVSSSAKDFANRYSYFSTHGSPKLARKIFNGNHSSTTTKNNDKSKQPQSKFELIGEMILTKNNVWKIAKGRQINIIKKENALTQLPIANIFHMRFVAQPHCYTKTAFVGFAEINNIPYTCTLLSGFLVGEELTRYPVEDSINLYRFSTPITPDTLILSRNNGHSYSFSVCNKGYDQDEFFVQDQFTFNNWIRALQQHIVDLKAWQICLEHMPRRFSQPVSSVLSAPPKANLRTKARSLDNINHTSSSIHFTIDRMTDPSCHTRL
ncbi:unnamed protein product [Didymodactylos carnosus]|uniref:REM-1 domain-containing protein n=2 Tax=Didymodactylos carnosus TaxID=1234261 RepID=A0A813SYG1_9BILA|nr:unnamed protein product [Didymodactylos carnosus]CAF3589758.1 unnamed protein product [Didymodactylos carnosus]